MHETDWAHTCPHLTSATQRRKKGFPVKRSIAAVAAFLLVVAGLVTLLGSPAQGASSWLSGHVQNLGWVDGAPSSVVEGATWAGSNGQNLRLEALRLNAPAEALFTMRGHSQNIGWHGEKSDGQGRRWVGTTGKALRLEAVQLTPISPELYTVWCQAYVAGKGWLDPVKNGATCGTTGESRRMETVRIWIEQATPTTPPATDPPATTPPTTPAEDPVLSTVATVSDIGTEATGLGNLDAIAATGNPLLILGDLGYSTPAADFCAALTARVKTVMWVQGNHENRDADSPQHALGAYQQCMPTFPDSSGEVGVQQVYKLPGAWFITASPQEAEPGAYAPGGPRWSWVRDQIRAAKQAGVWPILAMHEPHWTSGLHGSAGAESKALADLAVTEGVRLLLAGHDHNYSRINISGTMMVVAGMGGHNPRADSGVKGFVSCTGKPGFLTLEIRQSKIVGTVSGICADRFEVTR